MEEDKKVRMLSFEDTDVSCKVNIYGVEFEISRIDISRIQNVDKQDINSIYEIIKAILGKDSVDILNKKREENGYNKIGPTQGLAILGCIMDEYGASNRDKQQNMFNDIMKLFTKYNIPNQMNYRQKGYNKGYYGKRNKRY